MAYQGDKTKITGQIELVSEDISRPTMATPQLFNDFLKKIANTEQAILEEFSSIAKQTTTLKHGLQVVTTDRATPVNILSIKGRTLVNLLGKDGNCEDLSKFSTFQGTIALDTVHKVYGDNGLKVTITSGNVGIGYFYNISFRGGKFYIVLVDAKNGTATNAAINLSNGARTGNLIANKSVFNTSYFKYNPTTDISINVDLAVNGSVGQYAYFDCARVIEIDQATYNKIDVDPEYTGEKLAEKFPYVDSIQHLQNPLVKKYGKNLIGPSHEMRATAGAKSQSLEAYKATVTAQSTEEFLEYRVPAIPGQSYVMSGKTVSSGGEYNVLFLDDNNAYLGEISTNGSAPISFTTPTKTKDFLFRLIVRSDVTPGTVVTFENWQLQLGSVATPFEPQNDEYFYLQTKLASNADGTVYDSVFERDGKMFKMARFKELSLDGSLPWVFRKDFAGFKAVGITAGFPQSKGGNNFLVKFDGKSLINDFSDIDTWPSADRFQIVDWMDGALYLTIPDSDSGWGESYTAVTQQEIQALMNGWKAKTVDANGKPTAWKSILDNIDAPTQTLAYVSANKSPNWTGWATLTYQLAQAVEEPITAEGSLSFHEGTNMLKLGEGVIVRERANPRLNGSVGLWIINDILDSLGSRLKNRTSEILEVYRNGAVDKKWQVVTDVHSYGKQRALIDLAAYDPTAVYEVTYIALDKYQLTSPVLEASIQYATSDKSVLNEVVQQVSDNESRLSVVETTFAKKQQGQWISPILLNSWRNFGSNVETAGYLKDEFGFVHLKGLIVGGVITPNTILFVLPQGYRPMKQINLATISSNGSAILGQISVNEDGRVMIVTGGSNWLALDGLYFKS